MAGITTFERPSKPFVSQLLMTRKVTIDGTTAIDSTNTGQTHVLRQGLILAHNSADTGKYVDYLASHTATEGNIASCILLEQVDLKGGDPGAASADKVATVMWIGEAVSTHCIGYDAGAVTDLNVLDSALNGYILFTT